MHARRLAAIAGLVAVAAVPDASAQALSFARTIDPRVAEAAASPRRLGLLGAAEAALARGDPGAALASLETAAAMLHAPDTEMGIVRAHLQAGEYRRALAFCAHAAGAHRDAAATALYAWLLSAGGQAAFAQRVLDEGLARAPDETVLAEAGRQLAHTPAMPSAALLQPPHRMGPHARMLADQAPPPPDARTHGSGVLLDAGRHALVPLAAAQAHGLWVRDGLGRTTAAVPVRTLETLGLVVLRLAAPFDGDTRVELAPRDPFAGSPGLVAAYPAAGDATPSWPWLYAGFLGAGEPGARRLGVELPERARGGPVFDAAGRLAGVVLRDDAAHDRLVPASLLRGALGEFAAAPSEAAAPPARLGADETYERALRVALQVIVLP
jgi:tetratricopeptide (TPR) repeat protein